MPTLGGAGRTRPRLDVISLTQLNDLSLDLLSANRDPRHAHRQLEPAWPCAARIEIEHAAANLLLRHMTVAGDHHAEPCCCRLQVKLRQIVEYINGNAREFDDFCLREAARPRGLVDIAANRRYRRDARELLKNLGRTYVARVNDVFRSP